MIETIEELRVRKLAGNTPAPTVAFGQGFSGTITVTGNDIAGTVTLTINTAVSYAAQAAYFQLTFSNAWPKTPVVLITPANASTALLTGTYLKSPASTTFQVATASSGSIVAGTVLSWNYHVIA